MKAVIVDCFKSETLRYVFLRYVTYAIQFVITILLAKKLGENSFGIYSFILLFQQYASYANLGVNESLNVEYAKYYSKSEVLSHSIWGASWLISTFLSVLLILIGYVFFLIYPNFGSSYDIQKYAILLLIYCSLTNQNKIYITYYKLHGQLWKLNVQQLLPNILLFCLIFLFSKVNISLILIALIFGNFISLIIFRINMPGLMTWSTKIVIYVRLVSKGISLLLYNMSFYFITLTASSLVSYYYSVRDFGEYSLANSISNAVTMAGGAFLFIFYPKMISKFSTKNREDHRLFIERIRYINSSCWYNSS